jgi:methyl-accepting chemotaxis protein
MSKKIKSIKAKIIMFLIPMLLIAFITLSGLGYKFASDSLRKSNLNVMSEMTKTAAGRADNQIKDEIKSLQVIASNPIISSENVTLEEKIQILKPALKLTGQLEISVSDKNGKSIDSLGNKKEIKTTQSFMKSIKGEDSITNPYIDPISKKKVISYSVPIKDTSNNIIGIITSIKDCKDFTILTKEISFLQTGSPIIVDSNGNFIVAKDEVLVDENKNITNLTSDKGSLTDLNNIGKSMTIGAKSGIGKYLYDGKTKYMTYSPIGNTGLSIGITVEEKDLLGALNSLALIDAVVTIIMILLISSVIIGFVIKVINRLFGAKVYVDTIAKGDFYSQIDKKYVKANDEISQICMSVSQAKTAVGKMIKAVRNNAGVVRYGSVSLTGIAEKLAVLTEEISASIEDVSANTSKQSSDFAEITNKLVAFGEEMNKAKSNIHSISKDVSIINNKSLKGFKDIEQLNDGIIEVNNTFDKFAINIEYIKGDMKSVSEITDIINGISEQINILAINAAIEAASAGDSGRGFNIIAFEVKKLSDKSKESAQNINKIIDRLIMIISKIVEETKNMDSKLEKQKNTVYNTSNSFSEIALLVKEIAPKVSNIDGVFNNISYNKDLIFNTVYELSEQIKNTSNSLNQVTESSTELAELAEQVNISSDTLTHKANDLIEKVKQFKIEQGDAVNELLFDTIDLYSYNLEENNSSYKGENLEEANYERNSNLTLEEVKNLTDPFEKEADIYMVEYHLPKVNVAGSNTVSCSDIN